MTVSISLSSLMVFHPSLLLRSFITSSSHGPIFPLNSIWLYFLATSTTISYHVTFRENTNKWWKCLMTVTYMANVLGSHTQQFSSNVVSLVSIIPQPSSPDIANILLSCLLPSTGTKRLPLIPLAATTDWNVRA